MKRIVNSVVLIVFVAMMSGCAENTTRIGEGAGAGGLLGGVVGGIIGHQSGHDLQGGLIGAAVGAAAGAGIGSQIEKPEASNPVVVSTQLTTQQIIDMTKQGISGDEIISILTSLHTEQGITLVMITHDANIASHCQRIVNIKDGQIVSEKAV